MTDDEPTHPPTLPNVAGSSAPSIEIGAIPGPPLMPTGIDREAVTQPPGTFREPVQSEPDIVTAIRNAVREEIDFIRGEIAVVNDPNAGVLSMLKSLEESLQLASTSIATFSIKASKLTDMAQRMFNQLERVEEALHKHAANDRDQFAEHDRRIRELERLESDRRLRELEQWKTLVEARLQAGEDDGR